jgi:hypothetical protein
MMRYRNNDHFQSIERIITAQLENYGLVACFAKDSAYNDDLWSNITFYMDNAQYGIAVFEEIDEREFNPNVSFELGYMYAKKRQCLLLKDKRMPNLPTDVCGKIYRNFDTYDLSTVGQQIGEWCEHDLGLTENKVVVYNSSEDDQKFTQFWPYGLIGLIDQEYQVIEHACESKDKYAVCLTAISNEPVGANIIISDTLAGTVTFEYNALESETRTTNLFFCAIPMIGSESEVIEFGSEGHLDPANEISPYRVKVIVPDDHVRTGQWYEEEVSFDFSDKSTITHCIFGARINEGCPRRGKGKLLFRNVVITASKKK